MRKFLSEISIAVDEFDQQRRQEAVIELEKQCGPAVAQDIIDRIRKNGNPAKFFSRKAIQSLD